MSSRVVITTSSVSKPRSVGCLYPEGLPLGDKEDDGITKSNRVYLACKAVCFAASISSPELRQRS